MDPPLRTEAREACSYERIVGTKDWRDTDLLLDLARLRQLFLFLYERNLEAKVGFGIGEV